MFYVNADHVEMIVINEIVYYPYVFPSGSEGLADDI